MEIFKLKNFAIQFNKKAKKTKNKEKASLDPLEQMSAVEMGTFCPGQKLAPFHTCVQVGKLNIIARIIQEDPLLMELKTQDSDQLTGLLLSVLSDKFEIFKCLVQSGASLEALDAKGQSVLDLCLDHKRWQMLKYLALESSDKIGLWNHLDKQLRSDFENELLQGFEWLNRMIRHDLLVSPTVPDDNKQDKRNESEHANVLLSSSSNLFQSGFMLEDEEQRKPAISEEQTLNSDKENDDSVEQIRLKVVEKKITRSIISGMKKTAPPLTDAAIYDLLSTLMPLVSNLKRAREQVINCGIVVEMSKLLNRFDSPEKQSESVQQCKLERKDPVCQCLRNKMFLLSAELLICLSQESILVDEVAKSKLICSIVKTIEHHLMSSGHTETVNKLIEALGDICDSKPVLQNQFAEVKGNFIVLSKLLEQIDESRREQLSCVSKAIRQLSTGTTVNQNTFVDCNVAHMLTKLMKTNSIEVQTNAIEALYSLLDGNLNTQLIYFDSGLVRDLIKNTTHISNVVLREKTISVLWLVAESGTDNQRQVAEQIGGGTFTNYFYHHSRVLDLFIAKAIQCLARLPYTEALTKEHKLYALQGFLKILQSENLEAIYVESLQAIGCLLLGVGNLPKKHLQHQMVELFGHEVVLRIIKNKGKSKNLRLNAARVVTKLVVGNKEIMLTLISTELPYIVRFLHKELRELSSGSDMRSLAGACLADLFYKNKDIAKKLQMKLPEDPCRSKTSKLWSRNQTSECRMNFQFSDFSDLLDSKDLLIRASSAFQVVVLADVLSDQQPAFSSAAGIQILSDILALLSKGPTPSKNDKPPRSSSSSKTLSSYSVHQSTLLDHHHHLDRDFVIAQVLDLVACLSHMSSGIPEAFISPETIDLLFAFFGFKTEIVRATASIALGNFSFYPSGRRLIFNKCRMNRSSMSILKAYKQSAVCDISEHLLEDWKHFQKLSARIK